MVVYTLLQNDLNDEEVDRLFRALADATRRDILRRALKKESTVSELAKVYDISFAAVQKHISVLEAAQLVQKRQSGRERWVSGNHDAIQKAQLLLGKYEEIWRNRVEQLDAILAKE